MPRIRLTDVQFGEDAEGELRNYVIQNTKFWLARTKNYRENKLKEFAKYYKGVPDQKQKNQPWPNAANNVIQVIATQCDQLLSRVMAIYMVEPLWSVKAYGQDEAGKENEALSSDNQKTILESFLTDAALDSNELDMYRVEQAWWSSAVRNGTGVIKIPYDFVVEQIPVDGPFVDAPSAQKPIFKDYIRYDNPRPVNVSMNKFVNNLNYPKLQDSPFKFEIRTMSRFEMEAMVQKGIWKSTDVDKILASPDRTGKTELEQWELQTQGIESGITEGSAKSDQEFDIIECWFDYWHNYQKFSLCAQFHIHSDTWLKCFYNFYPENMCIFEDAKLAYDDDNYLGYGLAEMLKGAQDEISTSHNQKIDAGTLNNTTAFRINKNSKLHSILTFYPGVMVPADDGEIERLDTSNPHANDTNMETLTNSYVKERSGIDPATGGTGGGIVNPKRGNYSAGSTFAVMQQSNNRTSLRTADMRSAHTRVGDKITKIYAHFGLGSRIRNYANNADVLKRAFENIKTGKLGLLIRPSSASINKEMEKQNDILLSQTLERLYAGDAQIIQSLTTSGLPEPLKNYYMDVLRAKNAFMKHILRNFGYPDIDRLVPIPDFLKGNTNAGAAGNGSIRSITQGQRAGAGLLPVGSGFEAGRVPTGTAE